MDDDESLASVAAMTLTDAGFSVTIACDGLEAIEKIESHDFDAIVSDLDMSSMGLEF